MQFIVRLEGGPAPYGEPSPLQKEVHARLAAAEGEAEIWDRAGRAGFMQKIVFFRKDDLPNCTRNHEILHKAKELDLCKKKINTLIFHWKA